MRQLRDAMMVHPGRVRVSTTSGDVIAFEPAKEVFVPAYAVTECMRHGAKPVKVFKGTEKTRLVAPDNATVRSNVVYPEVAEVSLEDVEEVEVGERPSQEPPQKAARNSQPYTPTENKVRKGIAAVIADADPNDFTDAYLPKIPAINQHVDDLTVNASHRDRVWAKMLKNGDVTQDQLDEIFGEEDDGDYSDYAA